MQNTLTILFPAALSRNAREKVFCSFFFLEKWLSACVVDAAASSGRSRGEGGRRSRSFRWGLVGSPSSFLSGGSRVLAYGSVHSAGTFRQQRQQWRGAAN